MHRTQIYLKEDEYDVLKREAFKKNCSISEVLRNVIDNKYLVKPKVAAARLNGIVGLFKDDKKDVSKYHDKYLAENK
jgi:hypothetical protein